MRVLAGGELTGGKCVKFGDSVNTDLIMPGRYLVSIEFTPAPERAVAR